MSKSTRKQEIVNLVMRQTDYTEEQVEEKLKQWDNNYINVIKEYLNPNFNNKPKKTDTKTLNQQMMGEIRNFMDEVYVKFENRKRYNQYMNVFNQQAANRQQQQQQQQTNDESTKTNDEVSDNSTNESATDEQTIKIEEVV